MGTLVTWTGSSWKAETPKTAHEWELGQPVSARDGGLWLPGRSRTTDRRALFHRSSSGVWTRTPISPEPLDSGETDVLHPLHLAVIPGTSSLLRAGSVNDADYYPIGAIARLDLP